MADTWTAISGYTPQDYTDTAVFEVDSDTKKIALITGQALVAGEENSQYIKFLMPRYWDGIDIKDKDFYVEYALAGTYYGKTAAVNGEYNTEQVRFGWIVPKEACCISGTLLFVLRIESTDYVLKTQIAEHSVSKSVNVEDVVPEPTKEAWYREFEARVETAIDDAEAALTAAQAAQTAAENAALNAQTSEENAETAAAMAQTRYGSPLVAQTADEMVEQNRVYVYVGSESGYSNGHWYYYNGAEWTDGGVYNSVAVDTDTTLSVSGKAADAKATGDEINSIVNSAYVTDSASGSVAHFTDGANNVPLKSLKVNIVPAQSGSGDPSPDNVRPISGFNSVKVTRAGKNLLDTSNMSTASISGVTYSRSDDGVITVGGKATAGAYKQIAQFKTINGVQYTITGSPSGAANGKYRMTVGGYGYEYGSGYTFTGDGNTHIISIDVYAGYPESGTLTFKPMIRAASIADDTYESYNGKDYNISLSNAGTVYGGTLDVVSGVLTVYPYYASYNGEALTGEWISDRDVYAEGTTPTIGAQVVNIGAVGTEYQITPTEIKTLLGINNIWSDAGDVDVEYRASTKLWVQKKITEAVAAALNN